ncbi:hypothetical protein J3R30DRAFT_636527 [Lentinula aciculospora]|uniref:Uncharacterized protein n=1 Tax=Lentinula aciculospora TaxID=153920 RepID=A0A9W9DLS2_9AGAR|nr:hypothetical protein J3R30DRAFT_636527 [Lentinula aciculospora]
MVQSHSMFAAVLAIGIASSAFAAPIDTGLSDSSSIVVGGAQSEIFAVVQKSAGSPSDFVDQDVFPTHAEDVALVDNMIDDHCSDIDGAHDFSHKHHVLNLSPLLIRVESLLRAVRRANDDDAPPSTSPSRKRVSFANSTEIRLFDPPSPTDSDKEEERKLEEEKSEMTEFSDKLWAFSPGPSNSPPSPKRKPESFQGSESPKRPKNSPPEDSNLGDVLRGLYSGKDTRPSHPELPPKRP